MPELPRILNVQSGTTVARRIVSGDVSSGAIGAAHLGATAPGASGQALTIDGTGTLVWGAAGANFTSGCIVSGLIADGAVVSGSIASGQVGTPHLAAGSGSPLQILQLTASGTLQWGNPSQAGNFFPVAASSDISGYYLLDRVPSGAETALTAPLVSGDAEQFIRGWATVSGDPYATAVLGGQWDFKAWGHFGPPAAGPADLEVRVYKRDLSGAETLLFTVSEGYSTVSGTAYVESVTQTSQVLVQTDRLVFKYVAVALSGGFQASGEAAVYIGGTDKYTRVLSPATYGAGGFLTISGGGGTGTVDPMDVMAYSLIHQVGG